MHQVGAGHERLSPTVARWAGIAAVGAVATASLIQLVRATSGGIDLSNDSVYYLGGAQSLRLGHGFIMEPGAPIVWHAPGYSFLLAALGLARHNLLADARLLNCALVVIAVALVAVLVRRAGAGWLATIGATAAVGLSQPFLRAFSFAWSETLFVPLLLAAGIGLGSYLETQSRGALLGAGLALAGTSLARYSGFPLIAAAVVLVALRQGTARHRRLADVALLAGVSAVPPAAWLARNRIHGGTFTGRHVSFVLPPASALNRGLSTAAGWLAPPASTARLAVAAVAATIVFGLALLAVIRRWHRPYVRTVAILLIAYGAGVIVSRVLVDHRIPFDGRILLPAQVLALVLIAQLLPQDGDRRTRGVAVWLVAVLSLVAIQADSQRWITAHHRHVRYVERRDAPLAPLDRARPAS